MKRTIVKLFISFLLIVLYGYINAALHPIELLASGNVAGGQLAASDSTYVYTTYKMNFVKDLGLPVFVLFAALAWLWWPKKDKTKAGAGLSAVLSFVLISGCLQSPPANAYFDSTDKTEAYTILPNESAFWIPDVGDNKTNQASIDSAAYLEANKVQVKRFIVPHQKLDGSGGWNSFDAYVPTGRLIIVDRTTYSREWVGESTKGSSSADQSISCQGTDGINIQMGVAIGASVQPSNAAAYLYKFGVKPPVGERSDKSVIFASVYYGRSLAEVMDDVGRKQVQALICSEVAKLTFDQTNEQANKIMENVQTSVSKFFASSGITLDFIGWSGAFKFDDSVQKAINDRYVATTLQSSVGTLQALADIRVKEGLGSGLSQHGLPANLISAPESQLQGVGLGPLLNTSKK